MYANSWPTRWMSKSGTGAMWGERSVFLRPSGGYPTTATPQRNRGWTSRTLKHLLSPMIIETQRVNHDNLPGLLATLRGCWKRSSLLWMQLNGFPVLAGLILNEWLHETETAVSRFCRERNFSELLVRVEKPGQRWTRRRGGYTIPVSRVQGLVDELTNEGMLTLLLEPASPCSDLYGLTSVSDLVTGR